MKTYLTKVTLVLPEAIIADGAILVEDDRIVAICPTATPAARELDGGGAWCLPGLVDVHGDAIEKEVQPRPSVLMPMAIGVLTADRACVGAGVLTPFHSVSFSGSEFGLRQDANAAQLARTVKRLKVGTDAKIHVRYEVTEPSCVPLIEALIADGTADMLSFMDHSPGQGQFRTYAAYAAYMQGTYKLDEAAVAALVQMKTDGQAGASERISHLATLAKARGLALASHDDDSPERVHALRALGVTLCEFPMNLPTATAATAAGSCTILGAPNLVRGGSQNGNLKALEAVRAGAAGCLCSDYHPPSLLQAIFMLPDVADIDLPAAVRLATKAPAEATGLFDRGALIPGRRADLITVHRHHEPGHASVCQVELAILAGRVVLDARGARRKALESEVACG
jgi:alpha-D-ribose 1-methylphosphonate 5-triphosphate diphosphatase